MQSSEEDFGTLIARLREFQNAHRVVKGLIDEPEDLPAGPIPNIKTPTENDDARGGGLYDRVLNPVSASDG